MEDYLSLVEDWRSAEDEVERAGVMDMERTLWTWLTGMGLDVPRLRLTEA